MTSAAIMTAFNTKAFQDDNMFTPDASDADDSQLPSLTIAEDTGSDEDEPGKSASLRHLVENVIHCLEEESEDGPLDTKLEKISNPDLKSPECDAKSVEIDQTSDGKNLVSVLSPPCYDNDDAAIPSATFIPVENVCENRSDLHPETLVSSCREFVTQNVTIDNAPVTSEDNDSLHIDLCTTNKSNSQSDRQNKTKIISKIVNRENAHDEEQLNEDTRSTNGKELFSPLGDTDAKSIDGSFVTRQTSNNDSDHSDVSTDGVQNNEDECGMDLHDRSATVLDAVTCPEKSSMNRLNTCEKELNNSDEEQSNDSIAKPLSEVSLDIEEQDSGEGRTEDVSEVAGSDTKGKYCESMMQSDHDTIEPDCDSDNDSCVEKQDNHTGNEKGNGNEKEKSSITEEIDLDVDKETFDSEADSCKTKQTDNLRSENGTDIQKCDSDDGSCKEHLLESSDNDKEKSDDIIEQRTSRDGDETSDDVSDVRDSDADSSKKTRPSDSTIHCEEELDEGTKEQPLVISDDDDDDDDDDNNNNAEVPREIAGRRKKRIENIECTKTTTSLDGDENVDDEEELDTDESDQEDSDSGDESYAPSGVESESEDSDDFGRKKNLNSSRKRCNRLEQNITDNNNINHASKAIKTEGISSTKEPKEKKVSKLFIGVKGTLGLQIGNAASKTFYNLLISEHEKKHSMYMVPVLSTGANKIYSVLASDDQEWEITQSQMTKHRADVVTQRYQSKGRMTLRLVESDTVLEAEEVDLLQNLVPSQIFSKEEIDTSVGTKYYRVISPKHAVNLLVKGGLSDFSKLKSLKGCLTRMTLPISVDIRSDTSESSDNDSVASPVSYETNSSVSPISVNDSAMSPVDHETDSSVPRVSHETNSTASSVRVNDLAMSPVDHETDSSVPRVSHETNSTASPVRVNDLAMSPVDHETDSSVPRVSHETNSTASSVRVNDSAMYPVDHETDSSVTRVSHETNSTVSPVRVNDSAMSLVDHETDSIVPRVSHETDSTVSQVSRETNSTVSPVRVNDSALSLVGHETDSIVLRVSHETNSTVSPVRVNDSALSLVDHETDSTVSQVSRETNSTVSPFSVNDSAMSPVNCETDSTVPPVSHETISTVSPVNVNDSAVSPVSRCQSDVRITDGDNDCSTKTAKDTEPTADSVVWLQKSDSDSDSSLSVFSNKSSSSADSIKRPILDSRSGLFKNADSSNDSCNQEDNADAFGKMSEENETAILKIAPVADSDSVQKDETFLQKIFTTNSPNVSLANNQNAVTNESTSVRPVLMFTHEEASRLNMEKESVSSKLVQPVVQNANKSTICSDCSVNLLPSKTPIVSRVHSPESNHTVSIDTASKDCEKYKNSCNPSTQESEDGDLHIKIGSVFSLAASSFDFDALPASISEIKIPDVTGHTDDGVTKADLVDNPVTESMEKVSLTLAEKLRRKVQKLTQGSQTDEKEKVLTGNVACGSPLLCNEITMMQSTAKTTCSIVPMTTSRGINTNPHISSRHLPTVVRVAPKKNSQPLTTSTFIRIEPTKPVILSKLPPTIPLGQLLSKNLVTQPATVEVHHEKPAGNLDCKVQGPVLTVNPVTTFMSTSPGTNLGYIHNQATKYCLVNLHGQKIVVPLITQRSILKNPPDSTSSPGASSEQANISVQGKTCVVSARHSTILPKMETVKNDIYAFKGGKSIRIETKNTDDSSTVENTDNAPRVIQIKSEPLRRGYSDETREVYPALKKIKIEPKEEDSGLTTSSVVTSHITDNQTLDKSFLPSKLSKTDENNSETSKKDRISRLKRLLKEKEIALEELRHKRAADTVSTEASDDSS